MKNYVLTILLLCLAIFKLTVLYLYPNKETSLFSLKTEPWVYGLVWATAGLLAILGIVNQYRSTKL